MRGGNNMWNMIKDFFKEEDGIGVVEIILIMNIAKKKNK